MKAAEVQRAIEIATSEISLEKVDDDHLFGFALPQSDNVMSTIDAVAKMIRWQCCRFDGTFDNEELNNLRGPMRKKITIVSGGIV